MPEAEVHGRSPRLAILTPVFNDWSCIAPLLSGLNADTGLPEHTLVIVDDGSTEPCTLDFAALTSRPVEVIRLGVNVGHQRAIAAGLVDLAQRNCFDAVLIMDADGEDRPADCPALWQAHGNRPDAIIVAERRKRSEAWGFRVSYVTYRWLFRALTGQRLDFGNFSLLPAAAVTRISLMPELWNHYPATLMRCRLPLERVPLDRGHRTAGRSRMSLLPLVMHGVAGMAAFADTAFARLLALSLAAMGTLSAAIVAGLVYRLWSQTPLPGWLALAATALLVSLFQMAAVLVVVLFLNVSLRSQPSPPPTVTAARFIVDRQLYPADGQPSAPRARANR
ncbi:MAG: glycosyltransferase [Actinomycetales bacterium]|nr:glycosyltransferase [Actinomycetales bacterium]